MRARAKLDTPAQREATLVAAALDLDVDVAGRLTGFGGPWSFEQGAAALAAVLSVGELEATVSAINKAPRPSHRRSIDIGHHSRAECLRRPGEWCSLLVHAENRCDICPTRREDQDRAERLFDRAVELRREWDLRMWAHD